MKRATWLGVALGLAGMVSACGDSGATCGEGTMEVNGTCVPVATDGGTDDGGSTVTCGTGTTEVDGTCVPDGTVVCTDGTVFDADSGTCVLSDEACGEGTVLVDGACVPEELPMADVTEGAEPNDPSIEGATATDFALPDGTDDVDVVRLGGCIEPGDFDGDAETPPQMDVDVFAFSTTGPTVLRVRADGRGGLSPAFAVVPAGETALDGYLRVGLDFTQPYVERKLYVPAAGDYLLLVFDGRAVDLDKLTDDVPELQLRELPVGGAEACYVVSVEPQELPTPTELTADADGRLGATGTFGDPAVYYVAATDRTFYAVFGTAPGAASAIDLAGHVGDAVQTGPQLFLPAIGAAETPGEATIVVDHVYDFGLEPGAWAISAKAASATPDGEATLPGGEDGFDIFVLDGGEGDVTHFGFDAGDEDVVVFLFDAAGNFVDLPCGASFLGVLSCSSNDGWYLHGAAGAIYVLVRNASGTTDYAVTFTNKRQSPPTVGETAATVSLVDDEWTFVRADASALKWGTFAFTNFAGTGFTSADVEIFDAPEPGRLDFRDAPDLRGVSEMDYIWGPAMGGTVLLAIQEGGFGASHDGDEQVDVTFGAQSFEDVTVATDATESRTGLMVPADGRLLLLVQADAGTMLTVTATPTGGEDIVLETLDRLARTDVDVDDGGSGEAESWIGMTPEAGFVAFAVRGFGGTAATVDLQFEARQLGTYTVGDGTTTFSSICSATTEVLDADDDITSAITWDMGFSFDYFGIPTTGMVISTNGWLTLDTGYAGSSRFRENLGSTSEPNAVVAPFWDDLETRICVQQAADKVIVEWDGAPYGSSNTARFQAILYNDGRIEFVYDAAHDAPDTDTDVDVGLESQAGVRTVAYEGTVMGGQSILFTPSM